MKTITIDCTSVETPAVLHQLLADALQFPAYYGHNLDALYDCLTEVEEETQLTLTNWHALEYRLGDFSGKLVYVFHCATNDNADLKVFLIP